MEGKSVADGLGIEYIEASARDNLVCILCTHVCLGVCVFLYQYMYIYVNVRICAYAPIVCASCDGPAADTPSPQHVAEIFSSLVSSMERRPDERRGRASGEGGGCVLC